MQTTKLNAYLQATSTFVVRAIDFVSRDWIAPGLGIWIARLFLALMFLESAYAHTTNYSIVLAEVRNTAMPLPQLLFPLSIGLEVFGIFALLTGVLYRSGLVVLIAFTAGSTLFFFPFWALEGHAAAMAQQQFFKNMAVISALVLLHSLGQKSQQS